MKGLHGVALGALLLAGCGGGNEAASGDPYADLSPAIVQWKTELAAHDVSCQRAPAGAKCEMFEVSCKGARAITPKERAAGVTAKLVADLTWSGFDDKGAPQPASAVATFTKVGGAWRRGPAKPVNPESCADLG